MGLSIFETGLSLFGGTVGATIFTGDITIGTILVDEDSGVVALVDMSVSASPASGTEESIGIAIDGTTWWKVYAEADSSGGLLAGSKRIVNIAKVNLGGVTSQTINAGAITPESSYVEVVVQGGTGGGNDQLDTAAGGADGDLLILKSATSGGSDTVTVANGTGAGAFILAGNANFTMDHIDDRLYLIHNSVEWVEISRSSNS